MSNRIGMTIGVTVLAAGAWLAAPAEAYDAKKGDTLYAHGLVWNRDLPGVAGELKLGFNLRVNLVTGEGFGTAEDPVHPGGKPILFGVVAFQENCA